MPVPCVLAAQAELPVHAPREISDACLVALQQVSGVGCNIIVGIGGYFVGTNPEDRCSPRTDTVSNVERDGWHVRVARFEGARK